MGQKQKVLMKTALDFENFPWGHAFSNFFKHKIMRNHLIFYLFLKFLPILVNMHVEY